MNNFVQLQEFLTHALLSSSALSYLSVAQYRKLRLQGQLDYSALYATPRNGRSGCGLLVEMPIFEVRSPNLSGPVGDLVCPIVAMEEPNLNMEPTTGTLISAEEAGILVLDSCHHWSIGGLGSFYAESNAIEEAPEFEGLVAYRIRLRVKQPRKQTARVALPTISEVGGVVTLACATEGAAIYYTMDETPAAPSNEAALKYEGPFEMTGQVLYWAGFKDGMVQSEVGRVERKL